MAKTLYHATTLFAAVEIVLGGRFVVKGEDDDIDGFANFSHSLIDAESQAGLTGSESAAAFRLEWSGPTEDVFRNQISSKVHTENILYVHHTTNSDDEERLIWRFGVWACNEDFLKLTSLPFEVEDALDCRKPTGFFELIRWFLHNRVKIKNRLLKIEEEIKTKGFFLKVSRLK